MPNFKNKRSLMKELLDNEQQLNMTIFTEDGGDFKVHIEYVSGMSPFLKRVAIAAAKQTSFKSILIQDISRDVMSNLINFIYTGDLELSMTTVCDVAKAVRMLEIPAALDSCKKHILMNVNNDNCLKIYVSPEYSLIDGIQDEIKPYILRNFQQLFPVSSEYLNLNFDDLTSILSDDNLNVTGEYHVFWAIARWVEHDPDTRQQYLPNLLRCIRFGLCNPQFFEYTIQEHPRIKNNEDCQNITLQAAQMFADLQIRNGDELSNLLLDIRHPFLRPRTPNEILFVMGGWSSGSATTIIETFDIKSGRWFLPLTADNIPRAYHGMVWHKGYIYILGGFDGHQCFNDVKRYNPVNFTWEERGCMHHERCYISVAALDDYFYAIGGYDGHRRSNSCERYDPDINQWKMLANMNHVRSDASADTLNGKIYIAGGFNGHAVLSSAELYDPETDTWTEITNMTSPRSGNKVAAYNGCLYIVGGFNGNNRLDTVEKYDPRSRQWTPVPNMNSPRSNFAIAVLYDCLYAIGGFNGLATVPFAECYDYRKNAWTAIADLNINRSALAACTVKNIPNGRHYTFLGNATYQGYDGQDMEF